jgi:hypothetical protein
VFMSRRWLVVASINPQCEFRSRKLSSVQHWRGVAFIFLLMILLLLLLSELCITPKNSSLDRTEEGKRLLSETVSLLIGLCKSISPDRLGEETPPYGTAAGE